MDAADGYMAQGFQLQNFCRINTLQNQRFPLKNDFLPARARRLKPAAPILNTKFLS